MPSAMSDPLSVMRFVRQMLFDLKLVPHYLPLIILTRTSTFEEVERYKFIQSKNEIIKTAFALGYLLG